MASYQTKDIRNIALMGHGSEGKTTLMEALLFAAGAIDRQGRVEDGNTVTDYDAEEIKRKISISAAIAPIDWNQKMLNVIDVPGYFDFVGEMMGPLRVVETAAILVSAVSGIAVGTEKAWDYATKNNVGKMFIVNQMDRDHADFMKVQTQLRERFGNSVVPILLPIGEGPSYHGVVNVLENKAYERVNKGKPKEIPVPADMADEIALAMEEITEAAAMADDELTMKYLEEGTLTHEELIEGFKMGMFSGQICPVVPCSALTGVGVAKLLDVMADFLPSPKRAVYKGVNPKTGEEIERPCNSEQPFSALVYKTIADPFVGKLSLFKVMSGTATGSGNIYNASCDKTEKVTGIYVLRGKKQISTQLLNAGDMGAFSKLQFTNTGDTLCDPANPIKYPPIEYPAPCISKAVFAAKQGEEDKVFSGLARLMEEDPSIKLEKNVETTETLLSGQGELHLDVIRTSWPASSAPTPLCRTRAFPIVKPSKRPSRSRAVIRSSPAAMASSATYGSSFRPSATPALTSSLRMLWSAAWCRATSFLPWKRACVKTSARVFWLAIRWWVCMQSSMTAATIPWTPLKWPSRRRPASPTRRAAWRQTPYCWSPSCTWRSMCPTSTWAM